MGDQPTNGNGGAPSAAEWRKLVWDEIKGMRHDFERFRRDEFAPVKSWVDGQRGALGLADFIRKWGALLASLVAIGIAVTR